MFGSVSRRVALLALTTLVAGVALCVPLANATEQLQDLLPQYESSRFNCLICHVVDNPTDDTLNAFGIDFVLNGMVWDIDLANQNSDGDLCTNGAELGDTDGDGVPDINVTQENGNPGERDECASGALIEDSTWGELKRIFSTN